MVTDRAERPRCLVCGATALGPLYHAVRDHHHVARDAFDFLRCADCGSATLVPAPPPDELGRFYPPDYAFRAVEQEARRAILARLEWRAFYRPLYRQRARVFRRLTGLDRGLVLEVGCGSGHFLDALRRDGFDVEGIDMSAADAAYAHDRLGLVVRHGTLEDLRLPDERYDAVLLMSVLEHVPDPRAVMQEIRRILKPGGAIVLGVPMVDSWQAVLLGRRWHAVTEAPRHLMLPSRRGLRALLLAEGFRDVRARSTSLFENAGVIALSLRPSSATAASRDAGPFRAAARRFAGACVLLPALALAAVETLAAGGRSGVTTFSARK